MPLPASKLSQVRAAANAGDWREAIRIAARFPDLGPDKAAITRAWEGCCRPDFQRQVGRDPAATFAEGKAALIRRYSL